VNLEKHEKGYTTAGVFTFYAFFYSKGGFKIIVNGKQMNFKTGITTSEILTKLGGRKHGKQY